MPEDRIPFSLNQVRAHQLQAFSITVLLCESLATTLHCHVHHQHAKHGIGQLQHAGDQAVICQHVPAAPLQVAVFLAVARTGNLTSAASELGISQPAVSKSLHSLEQVGTALPVPPGAALFLSGQAAVPEGRQPLPHPSSGAGPSLPESRKLRATVAAQCRCWGPP